MMSFCLLLVRRPPGVTRADTRFPATSHCRSVVYRDWLDTWLPGAHAGTFRGTQMAMAAGSAVLRYLVEHNLPAHASAMGDRLRSEEHTSAHQSLMRISYPVFCLTKKIRATHTHDMQ